MNKTDKMLVVDLVNPVSPAKKEKITMRCGYCRQPITAMPRGAAATNCQGCGRQLDPADVLRQDVSRVFDASGKPTVCNLHQGPMQRRTTTVIYGRVQVDAEYSRARSYLFPYCGDVVLGGCGGVGQTEVEVNVCPHCCRLRDAWLESNPLETSS